MKSKSAVITLRASRVVFVLVVALLFLLPGIMEWYADVRLLSSTQKTAVLIAFYCCAVAILFALWKMDRLLKNIIAAQVFTHENVTLIRGVCICCTAVSLICLIAGLVYPSLILFSVIMGFLALVVQVVCQVIRAAVVLREENDLTI